MKKILSVLVCLAMLLACAAVCANAEDVEWKTATNIKFFNASGVEETPGAEGASWKTFDYWTGFNGSQVYDNNGAGPYVTATAEGTALRIYFGNNDANCNNSFEFYVDGELIDTKNIFLNPGTATEGLNGGVGYYEYGMSAGTHEIKVVAIGGEGWAGIPFNTIVSSDAKIETWKIADVKFFNSSDVEEIPGADGAAWKTFDYWGGYKDTQVYDNNGAGMYVTTEISCSKFVVYFGNNDGNCDNTYEIYVDGKVVATYNPVGSTTAAGCHDGVNCTEVIETTPGTHTIKVLSLGGEGWQGIPFNTIIYTEGSEADTADMTSAIALIGVIALAGIAFASKKH